MPAFVKHEASWEKAKSIVKKQYPNKKGTDFWRLVTTLYKQMEPQDIQKKANCFNAIQKISANLNKRADWLDDIKAKRKQQLADFDAEFSAPSVSKQPAEVSQQRHDTSIQQSVQPTQPKSATQSIQTRYDKLSGLHIPTMAGKRKPILVGDTWYYGDQVIGTASDDGGFVQSPSYIPQTKTTAVNTSSTQPATISVTQQVDPTVTDAVIDTQSPNPPRADGVYYNGVAGDYTLQRNGRTYNYNKDNVAVLRNLDQNRQFIDDAAKRGTIDAAELINIAAGDPAYIKKRDQHYASIPKEDINRVFKYDTSAVRYPSSIKFNFNNNSDESAYNWLSDKIKINQNDASLPGLSVVSNNGVIPDNTIMASLSEGPSADPSENSIAPYYVTLHEGIHGNHRNPGAVVGNRSMLPETVADITSHMDANNKREATVNSQATEGNEYAYDPVEQAQAISANSVALAATQQLLRDKPEYASQFDPAKVQQLMSINPMSKTREAFKQKLDFLLENPELAYALGPEGARILPIYQELKRTGNEELLDAFFDKYFLANNNANMYNNRRTVYA